MQDKIVIDTANSIWTLDTLSMIVTRIPRSEAGATHPKSSYDEIGRPVKFLYAHADHSDFWWYICIHMEEPSVVFENRNRRWRTGEVHPNFALEFPEIGVKEECLKYPGEPIGTRSQGSSEKAIGR